MLELEMPAGQVGEIRKVADVQIGYSNMLRKSNQQQTGTVSLSFAADSREVAARENREVTIQALELISPERNRMALVLRDQGRIADAEKVLRQNIDWLDKNRRRYKSKRLRILKDLNNDDAKNKFLLNRSKKCF